MGSENSGWAISHFAFRSFAGTVTVDTRQIKTVDSCKKTYGVIHLSKLKLVPVSVSVKPPASPVKLKPVSRIWWNHSRKGWPRRNFVKVFDASKPTAMALGETIPDHGFAVEPKKDGGFHLVTCPEICFFFENVKVFTNHRISALPGTECFTNSVA